MISLLCRSWKIILYNYSHFVPLQCTVPTPANNSNYALFSYKTTRAAAFFSLYTSQNIIIPDIINRVVRQATTMTMTTTCIMNFMHWMVQNIKSSFLTFNEEKLHYTCYYSVFSILLRSSSWLVFLKAYSLFFCVKHTNAHILCSILHTASSFASWVLCYHLHWCYVRLYTILCWVYYHHITIVVVICTCCCFFGLFCCTYPIQFNSRAVTFCVEN